MKTTRKKQAAMLRKVKNTEAWSYGYAVISLFIFAILFLDCGETINVFASKNNLALIISAIIMAYQYYRGAIYYPRKYKNLLLNGIVNKSDTRSDGSGRRWYVIILIILTIKFDSLWLIILTAIILSILLTLQFLSETSDLHNYGIENPEEEE